VCDKTIYFFLIVKILGIYISVIVSYFIRRNASIQMWLCYYMYRFALKDVNERFTADLSPSTGTDTVGCA
jgi:hypothetical protein